MGHVGQGRIVFWESASLWAFDVPYVPRLRSSTAAHSHHAIQITFAVDGSFRFSVGDETVSGSVVMIAPDVAHAFSPVGKTAMIFIEPESRLGAALLGILGGRTHAVFGSQRFEKGTGALSCIWEGPRPDDATLAALGRDLAACLTDGLPSPQPTDRRILRVLEHLAAGPDHRLDVRAAAELACLSESRFSHLFVEEVGLAFRTYVLWRRLTVAVQRVAAGESLTSAAHEAGFADSAHFSRTFLRMFGVQASLLQLI